MEYGSTPYVGMAREKKWRPYRTRTKSYTQNLALIIVIGFYEPYHDISSVFISNKTVSFAGSFAGALHWQVDTLGGGGGWKDVGMVATHCAVMCGLFVHALRCALLLVSLVFGELFFGESPSLHYLFLHFLAKCFFCNCIYDYLD